MPRLQAASDPCAVVVISGLRSVHIEVIIGAPICRSHVIRAMMEDVGFFDNAPSSSPDVGREGQWSRPSAQFPHIALADTLLLARTNEVAVAIEAIWSFRAGFEFWLKTLFRHPSAAPRNQTDDQSLHIGLQFADGRKVANMGDIPASAGSVSASLLLSPMSFGGGQNYRSRSYWVWPLPPPGPVIFACEWAVFNIGESLAEIEGKLILDAARRSVQVWPDDNDNRI